ncbi:MAG: hypothetical protein KDA42_11230 [Planctomycetales bacterium]|nr:hypothetical protein [Planctomycetales bacterium]
MHEFLFEYHRVPPTTWAYLSSLLILAIFFKFSRLWSIRNFDLIGLLLFAPGLLMVHFGARSGAEFAEHSGYVWLFCISAVFLIRLLVDPIMVRRPLLEPNLSVGGLTFLGAALLIFLMANVVTSAVSSKDLMAAQRAHEMLMRQEVREGDESLATNGPGHTWLFLIPAISTQSIVADEPVDGETAQLSSSGGRFLVNAATARTVTILSHLAIVIALVLIGYRHFDNMKTGIAAATLYLLLPYTAIWTGYSDHVLPAAILIWALESYRRPLVSGMLMGWAIGATYFPVFLLPLWVGFYWQRGRARFVIGVLISIALLVSTLALTSSDLASFLAQVKLMFGWRVPMMTDLGGFWKYHVPEYRMPVLAAFAALSVSFAIWPAQKNLGTLMSCSAAIMLGTQFWHPQEGGVYMAWYLPLLLLTVFRPNLEDRIALSVLGEGWFRSNRPRSESVDQAA